MDGDGNSLGLLMKIKSLSNQVEKQLVESTPKIILKLLYLYLPRDARLAHLGWLEF